MATIRFVIEIDAPDDQADEDWVLKVLQQGRVGHSFPNQWAVSIYPYRPGKDVLKAWNDLKIARGNPKTGSSW